MPGRLIICATPIGNLDDATPRLREALAAADVVFAEDTRRTAKLLRHLGVDVPQRSFFVGNEDERLPELEMRLAAGETVALTTDAGTPAVSDPGVTAVQAAVRTGAAVEVIPGPSAVTTALAVSGFSADRFVFEGFLPRRGTSRQQRLGSIAAEERTVVLFVATRRVAGDLADLAAACGPQRRVLVARELTKLHEELAWSTLGEAAARWQSDTPRGEYTVVLEPAPPREPDFPAALEQIMRARATGISLSEAVREAAQAYQIRRRALYEAALDLERKEEGQGDESR
ncbi:MAG TPA: 16S rRNA (cytidine(1402)-2'-O)-methyltransferase [Acidimicrobiia bacterium]|nr:16S rRNA (cytidine(1402)-2'-O)-methyltransferase [Acidimicrobiia bacterium]